MICLYVFSISILYFYFHSFAGDTVFVQGAAATPRVLVPALAEHGKKAGLKDVTVCHIHTEGAAEYNKPEFSGKLIKITFCLKFLRHLF